MRLIKLLLLSVFFLGLLVTLMAFLFPNQVRISRAVNLPNNRAATFALLTNKAQWPQWHPGYADSAGRAEMAALAYQPVEKTDSTFVVQLRSGNRRAVRSGWQLYGTPAADSLTLQWYLDFDLRGWPWQRFNALFFEQTYGRMMQVGLDSLKGKLIAE